jgi:hypothetical protein
MDTPEFAHIAVRHEVDGVVAAVQPIGESTRASSGARALDVALGVAREPKRPCRGHDAPWVRT